MLYEHGDYVWPSDLPRKFLCRIAAVESIDVGPGRCQLLELEPLEGPWPTGTRLVRFDSAVLPARIRELWQAPPPDPRGAARTMPWQMTGAPEYQSAG